MKTREYHGRTGTPEHKTWMGINKRCNNPNEPSFANYGGKGIKVCDRWLKFSAFLQDMGPRPSLNHSIDRINPLGDYEPDNCRWADKKTQNRNKRFHRKMIFNGKEVLVVEVAESLGIDATTLAKRVSEGWTGDDLVRKPSRTWVKRSTHCKNGHPYPESGKRVCIECSRRYQADYYLARKDEKKAPQKTNRLKKISK